MAEETLLKLVCANHGAMDYERLLDISYGLTETSTEDSLDTLLQQSGVLSVVKRGGGGERAVLAHTDLRLCRRSGCEDQCGDLHFCKYELMMGRCGRRGCGFRHQLMSEHNMRILRAHGLLNLTTDELCVLLLQSDISLLPPVCVRYNRGRGPDGDCAEGEKCGRLHLCEDFLRGRCQHTDCRRTHDFQENVVRKVLRFRGVSHELMCSLPFIYANILALKTHSGRRHTETRPRGAPENHTGNEICLSFVRRNCRDGECRRTHCKMPYQWQVKVGRVWHDLSNSEQIEQDYCDPSNTHSSGNEPVCFEDMTLGLDEVRRLSTESSVLRPGFNLTTCWMWHWKDEYGRWIPYASVAEMHRMSSVSSEQLEFKYQHYLHRSRTSDKEDGAGVKFSAGKRFYELSFRDMKQTNDVSGTEREVRRRPVFISSLDVQISRARGYTTSRTRFSKGVPGFWDQTAIPASGFQRVNLSSSHRDYVRVHERFRETLRGCTVRQIERVQNRALWEDFITKKEQMKMTNKSEKHGERLLFHATTSSVVDGVCRRNFGLEECEAGVYGKGMYFFRDARYRSTRTEASAVKLMFVCRVLLGYYTRGAAYFHQPPARNTEGCLYDSCVDNTREPSVFVVFDRSQIYPEFLISYEENELQDALLFTALTTGYTSVCSVSSDPHHIKPPSRGTRPLITVISSSSETHECSDTKHPASTTLPVSALTAISDGTSTAFPVTTDMYLDALSVSGQCTSTTLPVASEYASIAFPVAAECTSTALPAASEYASIAPECTSTALPVAPECASAALPFASEHASIAFPVAPECTSATLPVAPECTSTALPVAAKCTSATLPVAVECTSATLPVAPECTSTALPVAAKCTSATLPVAVECTSATLPVAPECTSTALPVAAKCTSATLPVAVECTSATLPVAVECTSATLPFASEHASTALPVAPECTSTAFPVAAECASTAFPFAFDCTSTAFPVAFEMASIALPDSAESASAALPLTVESVPTLSDGCRSSVCPAGASSSQQPVCSELSMQSQSAAVQYSVKMSRSSGSVLPHDHKANSSSHAHSSTNTHKPTVQKKNCVLM